MEELDDQALYYMEKAPVQKSILHMVLPMMLSFVAAILYNMTDAYFVGKLGDSTAMAAVTIAMPVFALLMALGHLMGTGSGTFISRLLGDENYKRVKQVGAVNFYLSLLLGVAVAVIGTMGLNPLVSLLGGIDNMKAPTFEYLYWYLLGSPFILLSFSLEECVRAEGASTASMRGMILGIAVNIVLDPIFIFALKFGIGGAAMATVIGNVVSVFYYGRYLHRGSKVQSISLKDFSVDAELMKEILKIGVSAFLMDLFMVVSGMLFNFYAAPYGDKVMASFGISQRLVQIIEFISMSFAMGTVPLFAFAFSSGNVERLKALLKWTLGLMLGITLLLNAGLLLQRDFVIHVFSNDEAVFKLCQYILTVQISVTLFAAVTGLLTGLFQAYGKGFESALMSMIRGLSFLPLLIIGHIYFGLNAVIWAMPIAEIIGFTVALGLYLRVRTEKQATTIEEKA